MKKISVLLITALLLFSFPSESQAQSMFCTGDVVSCEDTLEYISNFNFTEIEYSQEQALLFTIMLPQEYILLDAYLSTADYVFKVIIIHTLSDEYFVSMSVLYDSGYTSYVYPVNEKAVNKMLTAGELVERY